ncbi:hypothetical protein SK128_023587 [Halocaridina rubra]|uniref:Uncharacterized protein n=1 Tax=Halocaridina rubra TaxID=373956 RepID=A0AAN8XFT1_HALRR
MRLAPGSRPYVCHTPAAILKHWEVEANSTKMYGKVSSKVSWKATEWCSRMVVVAKREGHRMRTMNYQCRNASCLMEIYHTPAPFDLKSGSSRDPALSAPSNSENNDQEDNLVAAMMMATVAALGQEDGVVMDEDTLECSCVGPRLASTHIRVLAGDWTTQKVQELACPRPFYGVRDRLAVAQDLVTYTYKPGCLCLVAESFHHKIAANLHADH